MAVHKRRCFFGQCFIIEKCNGHLASRPESTLSDPILIILGTHQRSSCPFATGISFTHRRGSIAYPLQAEIQQQHRVLHTHIFKEVLSPPQTGRPNSLMVTEVDRWGVQRNRQPEFFFDGIAGHVRSDAYGNIDTWDQPTQSANYWRRHFNIPEVHEEYASWHNFPTTVGQC